MKLILYPSLCFDKVHKITVMPTQYNLVSTNSAIFLRLFGANVILLCLPNVHKRVVKYFSAEPVNSSESIMGANGGPCSGHLSLSQVALMEASVVGQLNSLPWISQTWAESPGENLCRNDVEQMPNVNSCIDL